MYDAQDILNRAFRALSDGDAAGMWAVFATTAEECETIEAPCGHDECPGMILARWGCSVAGIPTKQAEHGRQIRGIGEVVGQVTTAILPSPEEAHDWFDYAVRTGREMRADALARKAQEESRRSVAPVALSDSAFKDRLTETLEDLARSLGINVEDISPVSGAGGYAGA